MKIKYITLLPILVMMLIIFLYSSQPGVSSDKSSLAIVDEVVEIYEVVNQQLNLEPIKDKMELTKIMNVIVRKSAHIFVYTVLTFFVCIHISFYIHKDLLIIKKKENLNNVNKGIMVNYTLTKQIPIRKEIRLFIVSSIISFFYACFDELHQRFVPGRSGNIVDVGIDSIGIILGCTLFFFLYKLILRTIIFIINQFQFLY